jgi:drug/metabolite transporter (DMT)-like permease
MKRLQKLTLTQVACIISISVIGIVSTFMIFELNNNHNPLIIFILTKVLPVVIIVAGSMFILKEEFTLKKIIGIGLAICSIYLLAKD